MLRRAMILAAVIGGVFIVGARGVAAAPVQWSSAVGGNDHWYEVGNRGAWSAAKVEAEAKTYLGMPGYMVTITSAGENAFVLANFGSYEPWLGGSDEGEEGTWRWRGGLDSGQVFTYANWISGEPDNALAWNGFSWSYENYVQLNADGSWSDRIDNYFVFFWGAPHTVIEYGGPAVVPEPATLALLGTGLAGLGVTAWRRVRRK